MGVKRRDISIATCHRLMEMGAKGLSCSENHIHDLTLRQSASSYDRAENLALAGWPDRAVACPGCWQHWQHSQRGSSNCCSSPPLCPWIRRCRHGRPGELSADDGEGSGPRRRSSQAGCRGSKLTRTFGPGRDARDMPLQRDVGEGRGRSGS